MIISLIASITENSNLTILHKMKTFHASSFIQTNFIARILFYFSFGDLHIIHHFFPRIPSWKLPKATRLINSIVLSYNVPKRTLTEVLVGYYFKGKPYRELWRDNM